MRVSGSDSYALLFLLTRNCAKFPYFFLPRTLVGRLTAAILGSRVKEECPLQDKFLATPMAAAAAAADDADNDGDAGV